MKYKIQLFFCLIVVLSCSDLQINESTNTSFQQDDDQPVVKKEVIRAPNGKPIPRQYIVILKDSWDGRIDSETRTQVSTYVHDFLERKGIESDNVRQKYYSALRGFAATLDEQQLRTLQYDPAVESIYQDGEISFNLPTFDSDDAKQINDSTQTKMGQVTPWGVQRVGGPFNGWNKKVWVIDSGVDVQHPELNIDLQNSTSFITGETVQDVRGHGTWVSGIIAAKNNSTGVVGVAAGATIVGIKMIASNGYSDESIFVAAIDYAVANARPVDVINISGGCHYNECNEALVNTAVLNGAQGGLRFAVAAGNFEQLASFTAPASVEHANVWTVSAFDQNEDFVTDITCHNNGSNFGNPPIEFSGPGHNVQSLSIGGGSNAIDCGTSAAAPHIAGLLLFNQTTMYVDGTVNNDPDSTPDQIASGIISPPFVNASVHNNRPKLTWGSVSGASYYKILRRFEAGSWTQIATTTSTSFTDNSIYDPSLSVISSPPFNYEDFYSYKVYSVPVTGPQSTESNHVHFQYTSCSGGPGCGQ